MKSTIELIENKLTEKVKNDNGLVMLPKNGNWLRAYRKEYHTDISRLQATQDNCSIGNYITICNAADTLRINLTEKGLFAEVYDGYCDLVLSNNEAYPSIYIKTRSTRPAIYAFFSDGHIMQARSGTNKFIPATLKSLALKARHSPLFSALLIAYFETMSANLPICKDLLRDFILDVNSLCAPITMNSIIDNACASYQMVFENCYSLPYDVPKCVNKMPLREAYAKTKAAKYIPKNSIQKIMNLKFTPDDYQQNNDYDVWCRYYKHLIAEPCNSKRIRDLDEVEREEILCDYVKMAISVEKQVSLNFKSFGGLHQKHNDLVMPYLKKQRGKKMTIPKDSPFRKLKLPANYMMIKTGSQLYKEGCMMDHCVYAYADQVNRGTCVILHVQFNGKPYTAEIRIRRRKKQREFHCCQLHGKFNSYAPSEVWDDVASALERNQHLLT